MNNADKNNPITKQGDDEAHTFTAADDAKLVESKAAGKTWKEIVAEMKKSQSGLKERFKEIGPKLDAGATGNDKESQAKAEKGKKEAEAKAAEEKKKAEAQSQKSSITGKKSKKDQSNASQTAAKVITSYTAKGPVLF